MLLSPSTGFAVHFEAKVLSDIDTKTTHDVLRNQLARNVDCMAASPSPASHGPLGRRDPDRSFMVLLTPDLFRRNWTSRLYGHLVRSYMQDAGALHRDLPHLTSASAVRLSRRIAWLTFEDLRTIEPAACRWLQSPGNTPPVEPVSQAPGPAEGLLHEIVVIAPAVIPYETRSSALLEARGAIRSRLAELRAKDDEVLWGMVETPGAESTDLDNLLLFNIGGPIAGAARNGVVLERRVAADRPGARYRYRLIKRDELPDRHSSTAIVTLTAIPLARSPQSWLDVWYACRTAPGLSAADPQLSGELDLTLRVDAPGYVGSMTAQFVKTVIDGVLTALHCHADPATVQRVAPLMAARLDVPSEDIVGLLLNHDRAVLGTTDDLIIQRAGGIQCRPADDRLATLAITFNRAAACWGLDGTLSPSR